MASWKRWRAFKPTSSRYDYNCLSLHSLIANLILSPPTDGPARMATDCQVESSEKVPKVSQQLSHPVDVVGSRIGNPV